MAHNDLTKVVAFLDAAAKTFSDAPHKQDILYLHQGFNYGDYGAVNSRIPTYREYRDQDLLALICGARGLLHYNRMVAHYPELYIGMKYLTKEQAALAPVFLAPDAPVAPLADPAEPMRMLLKNVYGAYWLLACNASMRRFWATVPATSPWCRQPTQPTCCECTLYWISWMIPPGATWKRSASTRRP